MASAWRNFKKKNSRPLFAIIFRPEMLKFHPYTILTGETMVRFVIYCVWSCSLDSLGFALMSQAYLHKVRITKFEKIFHIKFDAIQYRQILWPSQNIRTLPKLQGNFSFSKTFFCLKKQLNVEQLLITPIIEAFLPNIFRLSCWFRLEIWKQVKEAIFDQGPKLFLGLNAKLKIRILNGLQRMHSTPWLRLARLA